MYLDDCNALYNKKAFTESNEGLDIRPEDFSDLKRPTSIDRDTYSNYLNFDPKCYEG